jgi:site-specific DNA-methyltransferase (cytosine-N4-specific)
MDWLNRCHFGDVRMILRRMIEDGVQVHTIVTSPPYWGLRSYLPDGHPAKVHEIGSEPTFAEFLVGMVEVFDLCRQVLRDDGTMWVNMGDSYASNAGGYDPLGSKTLNGVGSKRQQAIQRGDRTIMRSGLKPKDLIGQPWRLAFALQDAGWWLRQDIIWHKPNPMPESIRDRCTKAHEYIFLLAKSERYFYDFEAMQEPVSGGAHARRSIEHSNMKRPGFGHGYDAQPKPRYKTPDGWATHPGAHGSFHKDGREKGTVQPDPGVGRRVTKAGRKEEEGANDSAYGEGKSTRMGRGAGWRERKLAEAGSGTKNNETMEEALAGVRSTRNRRSVWTIPSEPYKGAHFATFPRALIEPCILAGCPAGGTVLDIFFGSGTTGQVAQSLGRNFIGIELNAANEPLQADRLRQQSLLLEAA